MLNGNIREVLGPVGAHIYHPNLSSYRQQKMLLKTKMKG